MSELREQIKNEAIIKSLFKKMPESVVDSFTDKQLISLFTALNERNKGNHLLDARGTVKFPFYKWRYYYVFQFGKNRRKLSQAEDNMSLLAQAIIMSILLLVFISVASLVLYLLKSALGIDVFSDYSFGVWAGFKELWQ